MSGLFDDALNDVPVDGEGFNDALMYRLINGTEPRSSRSNRPPHRDSDTIKKCVDTFMNSRKDTRTIDISDTISRPYKHLSLDELHQRISASKTSGDTAMLIVFQEEKALRSRSVPLFPEGHTVLRRPSSINDSVSRVSVDVPDIPYHRYSPSVAIALGISTSFPFAVGTYSLTSDLTDWKHTIATITTITATLGVALITQDWAQGVSSTKRRLSRTARATATTLGTTVASGIVVGVSTVYSFVGGTTNFESTNIFENTIAIGTLATGAYLARTGYRATREFFAERLRKKNA